MSPYLALEFTPRTPDAEVAAVLRTHFPFLHPSAVRGAKSFKLERGETAVSRGALSSRSNVRPPADLFSGPHTCAHDLFLGKGRILRAWRARGYDRRWHPLTAVSITRVRTFVLLTIVLMEPPWFSRWDCPPLRQNDDSNWAALLEGCRSAAAAAGRSLRSIVADPVAWERAQRANVKVAKLRRG